VYSLGPQTFEFLTLILTTRLIQTMKKLKYILKVYYIINYIIFDFSYF
jgi:hypothetical protein